MSRRKKSKIEFNVKNVLVLVVLIAIVTGYYIYTSRIADNNTVSQDEYELLSSKDLETSYPETPREVVKLYSRMTKCLYDDSLSKKKTLRIVEQMRFLFAESLLEKNSIDNQLTELASEVKAFAKEKKSIIGYEVDESSLVEKEVSGREKATIIVGFSIKHDDKYEHTDELFLLEKDEEQKWKIVGWQKVDVDSSEESQDGMEG